MITKVDRKYLEINSLNEINSSEPKINCKIEIKNPPDFQINKFFYKQIGKSYRWIDRLAWDDEKWMSYTNNSNLETTKNLIIWKLDPGQINSLEFSFWSWNKLLIGISVILMIIIMTYLLRFYRFQLGTDLPQLPSK